MQFNSYIFIMAFLPVLVTGYFLLNKLRPLYGKLFLIVGSAVFYVYGGWDVALVLLASILVNYGLASLVPKAKNKRLLLAIDVLCNVGLLLYFKYSNFFISNVNSFAHKEIPLLGLVLPLGISFFTFQQIMYVVNVSRGDVTLDILDYLAYILYFPKLLMGPLNDPKDFIGQVNDPERKRVDWDNIACGIKVFSFGLFKKVLLADTFAAAVSWGFENLDVATSMDLFLVMLFYTFQIYFDFSGYTDMAMGVSTMLNIDLPMNFDSPYKALSIRDFWKRWHISLTNFFTKYVYIPLGGSRKGKLRTYVNVMIIFLISGIWHGANWTFLLWGALHGLFSLFDRIFEKQEEKITKPIRWGITFLAVSVLWLLFRSESIGQWAEILGRIFRFQSMAVSGGLNGSFILAEASLVYSALHLYGLCKDTSSFSLLLFTLAGFFLCLVPKNNYKNLKKNSYFMLILAIAAFLWSFLSLTSESVFVYFNF